MQLVPKQLAEVMSKDIDITNDEELEQYPIEVVNLIAIDEDMFPAEKADKYIWILNRFEQEKAYWESKKQFAEQYMKSMEKMEESIRKYIRFLMVDDEVIYGTDQKIVAQDYKKSLVDEFQLSKEEFTFNIETVSWNEKEFLKDLLTDYLKGALTEEFPIQFLIVQAQSLLHRLENSKTKPFGVTRLGEDHPAVKKEIRRSIKVKPLTQKELKSGRP